MVFRCAINTATSRTFPPKETLYPSLRIQELIFRITQRWLIHKLSKELKTREWPLTWQILTEAAALGRFEQGGIKKLSAAHTHIGAALHRQI